MYKIDMEVGPKIVLEDNPKHTPFHLINKIITNI